MTALIMIGGMVAATAIAEGVAPKIEFIVRLINDTLILWGVE